MKKIKHISLLLPLLLSSCNNVNYELEDYRLTLDIKDDNFKIMQLTDIHIGIETNLFEVKALIKEYIEEVNPSLMVLTGDTFMNTTKNITIDTLKYIDSFDIPFAYTYGNHDLQGLYSADFLPNEIMKLKNSLYIDFSDDDLYGRANYFIDINKNNETLYRLFILDSNNYYSEGFELKFSYDVIHEEQIKHIEEINEKYPVETSIAYFHIPFHEYQTAYNLYKEGKIEGRGENNEKCSVPYKETDAFTRMKNSGVKAFFIGHDHLNSSDLIYEDTILSYGIKSTYEMYNDESLVGVKYLSLDDSKNITLDNIKTYLR